jgi:hypothetical protein
MERLGVSGAVRLIYGSLGVKRLIGVSAKDGTEYIPGAFYAVTKAVILYELRTQV